MRGPVEERAGSQPVQGCIVFGAVVAAQQVGVIGGAAHHSQYAARLGVYGHNAAYLVGHQLFGIFLQAGIKVKL